jgi:hypothetical protein
MADARPVEAAVTEITGCGKRGHRLLGRGQAKLNQAIFMNDFGVLSNRKRALIALIHSVVFLGIATHGFASPKAGILVPGSGATGDFVLIGIYFVVASILAWLVSIARCAKERVYFALCASSATFGLLRTIFGDATIPVAQYFRVIMLTSAVMVGGWILRSFSWTASENVFSD